MWDSLIRREIQRSTRNVIVVNLLLLGGLLATGVAASGYLYAVFAGPVRLEAGDLLTEAGRKAFQGKYVRVSSLQSHSTRWQDVQRRVDRGGRVKGETVSANYSLLVVGDKLLVVRHGPGTNPGADCSGRLLPLPEYVRTTFINPSTNDHPEARQAFLNVMLEHGTAWLWPGYIGLTVGCLLALFALRNLGRAVRFRQNPSGHPQLKRLAARGDLDRQLVALQDEADKSEAIGEVRLLPHWLLRSRVFGFTLLPLTDLAWGTMWITRHSVNSIPTSSNVAVHLYDLNRRKYKFAVGSQREGEDLLRGIVMRVPWILLGGEELQHAWNKNPDQVLEAVGERRKQYYNYLASRGSSGLPEPAQDGPADPSKIQTYWVSGGPTSSPEVDKSPPERNENIQAGRSGP
jgi:hypothetical protein